jgi:hypothetical protein
MRKDEDRVLKDWSGGRVRRKYKTKRLKRTLRQARRKLKVRGSIMVRKQGEKNKRNG